MRPRGGFFWAYISDTRGAFVADVLDDLDSGRLQDRIVDVLPQQAP